MPILLSLFFLSLNDFLSSSHYFRNWQILLHYLLDLIFVLYLSKLCLYPQLLISKTLSNSYKQIFEFIIDIKSSFFVLKHLHT